MIQTRPRAMIQTRPRGMASTLVASVAVHGIAFAVGFLLLQGAPRETDAPDKPIAIELVMEERAGGAQPEVARMPAPPSPPQPGQPAPEAEAARPSPPPEPAAAPRAEATVAAEPPPDTPGDTPGDTRRITAEITPPSEPKQQQAETKTQAAPPPPPPAAEPVPPTISLSGTDSPSDARALGPNIIPAALDAVFHNRPPEYPVASARAGERGAVVLVIHVAPSGQAVGADVVRSSGFALLDRAAREAVLHWKFLPAVKDGQNVSADMTMQFVFDNR